MVQRKPPEGAVVSQTEPEPEDEGIAFEAAEEKPILSDEEVAVLRLKAKDKVSTEIKKKAQAAKLAEFEREERISAGLDEPEFEDEQVDIKVNLAPYADRAMIDFKIFLHGHTYSVPRRVANVIMEMCDRSWAHQREIKGERLDADLYRAQGATISAKAFSQAKVGNRVITLN